MTWKAKPRFRSSRSRYQPFFFSGGIIGVGKLYVVSTPIGNLGDITLRAIEILSSVDLVACEDTRETRKLLTHHGIRAKTTSFHEHNKEKKTPGIIRRILSGEDCAIVSDRGTPAVSDPGFYLVRAAIEQDIKVVPIPGSSAILAALVVSGLPTDQFLFTGFLPRKKSARGKALEELKAVKATLIIYSSPRLLIKVLEDLTGVLGDRNAAIVREVTKLNEEVLRGKLSELSSVISDRAANVLGEFVLLVEGSREEGDASSGEVSHIIEALYQRPPESVREGVAWLVEHLGIRKNQAYDEVREFLSREEVSQKEASQVENDKRDT